MSNPTNPAILTDVIGKEKAEAADLCKSSGFRFRVVSENGEHFMVTCDYDLERVNAHIINGKVTSASLG